VTVEDFEEKVWEIDRIRIVVRAPAKDQVDDYNWQNSAAETQRVTEWLETRIVPKIGAREVIVIGGDGEEPHGRTLLRTLRDGYRD